MCYMCKPIDHERLTIADYYLELTTPERYIEAKIYESLDAIDHVIFRQGVVVGRAEAREDILFEQSIA